jgi:hypothetical protein
MSVISFPNHRPITVEPDRMKLLDAFAEACMLELELQSQFLQQRRRRLAITRRLNQPQK